MEKAQNLKRPPCISHGLFHKMLNKPGVAAGQTPGQDENAGELLTPLKSVEIKAVLEGCIATINVEMVYLNPREHNPIECSYELPLEKRTLVSKLEVQIEDKII